MASRISSRRKNETYRQPTTFVLEPEAVDRLRAAGGAIILDSPELERLLKDLGATLVTPPPAAASPAAQ